MTSMDTLWSIGQMLLSVYISAAWGPVVEAQAVCVWLMRPQPLHFLLFFLGNEPRRSCLKYKERLSFLQSYINFIMWICFREGEYAFTNCASLYRLFISLVLFFLWQEMMVVRRGQREFWIHEGRICMIFSLPSGKPRLLVHLKMSHKLTKTRKC